MVVGLLVPVASAALSPEFWRLGGASVTASHHGGPSWSTSWGADTMGGGFKKPAA